MSYHRYRKQARTPGGGIQFETQNVCFLCTSCTQPKGHFTQCSVCLSSSFHVSGRLGVRFFFLHLVLSCWNSKSFLCCSISDFWGFYITAQPIYSIAKGKSQMPERTRTGRHWRKTAKAESGNREGWMWGLPTLPGSWLSWDVNSCPPSSPPPCPPLCCFFLSPPLLRWIILAWVSSNESL